jgi:nitrite reductase/ring-hydroxylating ferredoxin subunit
VKEKILVANVDELKEMEPRCLEHHGVPYCIIRRGDEVRAYVSVCSHEDLAMYPPIAKKGRLICPHHKVSFDPLTGEVINDHGKKTPTGLPPVTLEIVAGAVFIETRKRHRRFLGKKERHKVERKSRHG